MPGGFNANMAESAHDPPHPRMMVPDDGTTKLAMVVVDSLGVSPEVIEEAKAIASRETAILPASRMLVCSTHSQQLSAVRDESKRPAPAVAYRKQLLNGIAKSIIDSRSAAAAGICWSSCSPARRGSLQSALVLCSWQDAAESVRQDGHREDESAPQSGRARPDPPVRRIPDITVISVLDAKKKPLPLFANYSLHYVGEGIPSRSGFGRLLRRVRPPDADSPG